MERGIVRGRIGETKTTYSQRAMNIDTAMLATLKTWNQNTQFSAIDDWVFVSSHGSPAVVVRSGVEGFPEGHRCCWNW